LTPDPTVAAVITVNDMYHELQGVRADVQQLAGKFDDMPRQIADHEARLRLVDGLPADVVELKARLTAVEARKHISPAALVSGLTVIFLACAAIAGFLALAHH
jgi:hypothetical protein